MKVFIGGSRKISHLNDSLPKRIDQMIEKNLQILLGDANGADKAVQTYLDEREYEMWKYSVRQVIAETT